MTKCSAFLQAKAVIVLCGSDQGLCSTSTPTLPYATSEKSCRTKAPWDCETTPELVLVLFIIVFLLEAWLHAHWKWQNSSLPGMAVANGCCIANECLRKWGFAQLWVLNSVHGVLQCSNMAWNVFLASILAQIITRAANIKDKTRPNLAPNLSLAFLMQGWAFQHKGMVVFTTSDGVLNNCMRRVDIAVSLTICGWQKCRGVRFSGAYAGVVDTEFMMLWSAKICWHHMLCWWACTPSQPWHSVYIAAPTIPEWSAFPAIISKTNSINRSCKHTEAANVDLFVLSLEAGKFHFFNLMLTFKLQKVEIFRLFAISHFARFSRCSINQAPCKVFHCFRTPTYPHTVISHKSSSTSGNAPKVCLSGCFAMYNARLLHFWH